MRRAVFLSCAGVIAATWSHGQSRTPATAEEVLTRAAAYVQEFESRFALALSDERYEQFLETRSLGRVGFEPDPSGRRLIHSEVLFVWIPQEALWVTTRNALLVDGQPVAHSAGRLEQAFGADDAGRLARLGRLREESARFNIGRIRRNFGDPTFALQFAAARLQRRFRWEVRQPERVNGIDTWRLDYREQQRPTLIRRDRTDLPASGSLWIDPVTGTIARTRLYVSDTALRTRANIDVDYRRDDKIGTWVPSRMIEHYEQRQVLTLGADLREERIRCEAVYSNHRRFDTHIRVGP